jgi:hypothetical protein
MHRYFVEPAALSVPKESAKRLSIVLSTSVTEDLTPPSDALTLELADPPESLKVMSVVKITILDYLSTRQS